MTDQTTITDGDSGKTKRRGFIATILMLSGVAIGYGTGLLHFFEFLVPLRNKGKRRKMFAGTLNELPVGHTRNIKAPSGEEITL